MKKSVIVLLVIVLIIIVLVSSIVKPYNKIVTMEESVSSQWAQVENVYQRRADLIPNLVNTVKGMLHMKETFER
jgi:LemA protein